MKFRSIEEARDFLIQHKLFEYSVRRMDSANDYQLIHSKDRSVYSKINVNTPLDQEKPKVETKIVNDGQVRCLDCNEVIPKARLDAIENVERCAKCQSNYESDNPETISRKVEEKLGTREDFKNMSRKQFGTNTSNKN